MHIFEHDTRWVWWAGRLWRLKRSRKLTPNPNGYGDSNQSSPINHRDVKVTTLVENTKGEPGLAREFGLSLYIETIGCRVLFDMGKSPAFAMNARKLNLNLEAVDIAILSHGHYDHGGGLAEFFSVNHDAPLYLRSGANSDLYARFLVVNRYVGLDTQVLDANARRLRWIDQDTEIVPGLNLLTTIPDTEWKPKTERTILIKEASSLRPDTFEHELVLVVRENDGISVITGCGHLGVLNMVLAARMKFPKETIKAVIGGFHLFRSAVTGSMATTEDEIRAIAARFRDLGCRQVISGHCTGKEASSYLKRELGEKYRQLRTGAVFQV